MALLTICQHTFQNVQAYEDAVEDVEALKVNVRECYSEITKTSEQIQSSVRETYLSKSELESIQQDFQASITQNICQPDAFGGVHPVQRCSDRTWESGKCVHGGALQ